jgi:hypothetical protein
LFVSPGVTYSLDWLERLIWTEVVRRKPSTEKGRPVTSVEDYGFSKGYLFALEPWQEVLDGLRPLCNERRMMVIRRGRFQGTAMTC